MSDPEKKQTFIFHIDGREFAKAIIEAAEAHDGKPIRPAPEAEEEPES